MSRRRVDLRTAAESLGTSVDAVRKRIQRGTLESEKGEDGKVYVWLDAGLEGESSALISELRDRVDFMQRELERKDAILLNMTEAMKALSPPPEANPPAHDQETSTAAEGSPGGTSGPLSALLRTAGTTAVATLVAQAVAATIAAFSAVQGELRITLYIITLQVLLMAGAYLSVRRQSAKTPVPEGERSLIPTSFILVAAGLVVALLTFAFVYFYSSTLLI